MQKGIFMLANGGGILITHLMEKRGPKSLAFCPTLGESYSFSATHMSIDEARKVAKHFAEAFGGCSLTYSDGSSEKFSLHQEVISREV